MAALFLVLLFLIGCKSDERYGFLEGSWEVEVGDRIQYEHWEESQEHEGFTGSSYEIVDGEEKYFEWLEIIHENDKVYMVPTVPDQNDGRPIRFELNEEETDWLSFENPDHDFPNVIRYKKITDDQLEVEVLGNSGDGFSMIYNRVAGP